MNKRLVKRFALVLLVIALGIVAYEQFIGRIRTWYSDNYIPRVTLYAATEQPDQVCLTWNGDPKTTQAIQWRAATSVMDGQVEFRETATPDAVPTVVEATRAVVDDPMLKNDPSNARFTATATGLRPATNYTYRVGSKQKGLWSGWMDFTTAPAEIGSYSFIYLGDPQVGLESWGKLIHGAQTRFPQTAFYVIAGDLVNSGSYRNEWDRFFEASKGIFDRRPVVPVLGNHDYDKKDAPNLYLNLFALPENGPKDFPVERAYSYSYGNVLFVVLDSNLDPEPQLPWLEEQLSKSTAKWKLVSFHHPFYSSAPHRDNHEIREAWGPVFDKYHVDLALQGHDHAYLRTHPMYAEKQVPTPKDGSIYVVSVSGTKYYEQESHEYAAVAFANVSTYQLINISTNPDRLSYRAYDKDAALKDEVIIEK